MGRQDRTIAFCLTALGASNDALIGCSDVIEEFGRLKKLYLKKALQTHPDKGGDVNEFRDLQSAWESVRSVFENGSVHPSGFSFYFKAEGGQVKEARVKEPRRPDGPIPSWEWYAEAAEETVPNYRVEPAKSGRSRCKSKVGSIGCCHGEGADDNIIPAGELRFGSLDTDSGTYGRWHHLKCWRVPSAVWTGFPPPRPPNSLTEEQKGDDLAAAFAAAIVAMEQLVFCGFSDLSEEQKDLVVQHAMDPSNWAAKRAKKKASSEGPPAASSEGHAAAAAEGGPTRSAPPKATKGRPRKAKASAADFVDLSGPSSLSDPSANALVSQLHKSGDALDLPLPKPRSSALVSAAAGGIDGGAFVVPRPGVNGALEGSFDGKTFVLTGIFPELGGGAGLDLGKARCKAMIEAFGGRVTGSVSGKTSYLVIGKSPGASKVSGAADRGIPTVDVRGIKSVLEAPPGARLALEDVPAQPVTNFSAGYKGRNLLNLGGGCGGTDSDDDDHRVKPAPRLKGPKTSKKRRRPAVSPPIVPIEDLADPEPVPKRARKVPSSSNRKKGRGK